MPQDLQVITLNLGELQTNCYLAICPDTNECLIIDPADSGETITAAILEQKLTPLAIVFTHGHFDHILAALELKLNFNIPIMMHQADLFLIESVKDRAKHWLGRDVDPVPKPKVLLEEGNILPIGRQQLLVIETPGHTPGSICLVTLDPEQKQLSEKLFFPDEPILFTGDTLFKQGIGRTDRSYSSPKAMRNSLKKLSNLPGNTICYPGHGEITFLASELLY